MLVFSVDEVERQFDSTVVRESDVHLLKEVLWKASNAIKSHNKTMIDEQKMKSIWL